MNPTTAFSWRRGIRNLFDSEDQIHDGPPTTMLKSAATTIDMLSEIETLLKVELHVAVFDWYSAA